ncbi:MAG: OmpA family protein [Acidobacteria bacterium]|nr:OmpA family protein [Acidobacteriota bacterium]
MKKNLFALMLLGLAISLNSGAQAQDKNSQVDASQIDKVAPGKNKLTGVIVSRDVDTFIVRDLNNRHIKVVLDNTTKVEEKKSNPFRRSKNYGTTQLLRGLTVQVEGRSNADGALVAEKVKMTDDALVVARTVESRVTPVEGRVDRTETKITQVEENARRISGQIDELNAITTETRTQVNTAQATANAAVTGVEMTNKRIDQLVTSLDEYQEKRGIMVNFKVASAKLTPEAMMTLDEIAQQAKVEKAYIIEVTGFASAEGKAELNQKLSQQRADAVVTYLVQRHDIPLRRIITPFGYGTLKPVADNETREGREQNRRVEVKVLVNRGLTAPPAPVTVSRPNSTGGEQ